MVPSRIAVGVLCALAVAAAPAAAQQAVPLAGKGENIQPIGRVPIPRSTEVELAGDWAFVATDRGDGKEGGLTIVNIADPTKAYVESVWTADMAGLKDGSYGDVDLSPDGKLAVLTNAHAEEAKEGEVAWTVLIDVSDKKRPKLVGKFVDDATTDYVHTATLDDGGKTLYLNPQVWAGYPQPGNARITVLDISDPSKPTKKGQIQIPGGDVGLAHDTYIDHRPDGRSLMYAGSVHKSDVIDVSNPLAATWLQSATSPQYTLSHDVQPNYDRSLILVDDEGLLGGQLDPSVSYCGKVGSGPASVDSGSISFFKAAPDGTFADGGALHLGSFNAPVRVNTKECVAHVFWQAPNENRLTQAYYRSGAFVLDFEDPANPKELGYFVADQGTNYWSNKPHRGYLYASSLEGSLDILRYTGEGGKRWPSTAGPAEVQRSARQGVPYVPLADVAGGGSAGAGGSSPAPAAPGAAAPAPRLGRFAFTAKARRVPGRAGRRTTLTLAFTDAKGKPVGRVTVRKPGARRAAVKVTGIAAPGRYRWTLRAGRRRLAGGRVTVRAGSKALALSPGATLAATAR